MTGASQAAAPLPRQLTDGLAAEVRAVAAPPIPTLAEPYTIRVADPDADAELVAEWMNRPHLAATWEYAWPVPRWRDYLRAQLAGGYSRPLIVSRHGVDGGYVEIYRAARDRIATRYDAHPHDLGIHAAIADPAVVNRGLAPILLPRLVAAVFALEPQCARIMFDPDHRNTAARRLCAWAGGVFLGEHDMPNRRMALYALPRPAGGSGSGSSPNSSA